MLKPSYSELSLLWCFVFLLTFRHTSLYSGSLQFEINKKIEKKDFCFSLYNYLLFWQKWVFFYNIIDYTKHVLFELDEIAISFVIQVSSQIYYIISIIKIPSLKVIKLCINTYKLFLWQLLVSLLVNTKFRKVIANIAPHTTTPTTLKQTLNVDRSKNIILPNYSA